MLAMNASPRRPTILNEPRNMVMLLVNGAPVLAPADWNVIGRSIAAVTAARGPKMPELFYATKPKDHTTPSWQSLIGLDTLGDAVLNPQEAQERRPSPIGSRHGPRRAPTPVAPAAQQARARPLPTPPRVAQADQGLRELPIRPSSAPPFLERPPGLPALQEVEERPAAVPGQPAPVDAPALPAPQQENKVAHNKTSKDAIHNLSECQGDPLCPTHRRRPQRKTGPHARTPLQLWEARPKFGYRQCNNFYCTGRHCVDCAYLSSRGSRMWAQLARPMIEDKLDDIDFTSTYAEDTLALLRLRATFQVRRSMV